MSWLDKFMVAIQTEWEKPTLYGWKHLLFLGMMIGLVVLVCFLCRRLSDSQFRKIMLGIGIALIVLEIFKQLIFAYDKDTGIWKYDWKQFPFQFCSVPMYVMVIVGCLKECKFRDYLCSFLATFGLFAGIIVMLYPSTVLSSIIVRFCQSMIHHMSMVIGGFVVIVSGKVKFEHKTVLKAMAVFSVAVCMAFLMNIIFHLSGNTASFNMFYIGPFSDSDIPVFHQIGQSLNISSDTLHWGNFVFILIYIIGFAIAAYLILLIEIFIHRLVLRKRKAQAVENNKIEDESKV